MFLVPRNSLSFWLVSRPSSIVHAIPIPTTATTEVASRASRASTSRLGPLPGLQGAGREHRSRARGLGGGGRCARSRACPGPGCSRLAFCWEHHGATGAGLWCSPGRPVPAWPRTSRVLTPSPGEWRGGRNLPNEAWGGGESAAVVSGCGRRSHAPY